METKIAFRAASFRLNCFYGERMKKIITFTLLMAVFLLPVAAQNGRFFDGRLSAVLNLRLSVMKAEAMEHSDIDDRQIATGHGFNYRWFNVGPTDQEFFEDAEITIRYEGERFGGQIGVVQGGLGGFNAWVRLIPQFRVSVGTALDSEHADTLGAPYALRIFTGSFRGQWNAFREPDNIAEDEGLMLDFIFSPLTISVVATRNDILNQFFDGRPDNNPIDRPIQGAVALDRRWQYGGRIALDIGDFGAVGVSYIVQYETVGNRFGWTNPPVVTGLPIQFVARQANAEVFNHLFGAYASLTPMGNLGITAAWVGEITQLVDSFIPTGQHEPTAPAWPTLFRQAINFNARFTGIPGFTFRTDNNFTFWEDLNYNFFQIAGITDIGLQPRSAGEAVATVGHRVLWNGLGAFYNVTDNWDVGIYARNLRRITEAGDYRIAINEFSIEPRATWRLDIDRIGSDVEFFIGVNYMMETEIVSQELNQRRGGRFRPGRPVLETRDVKHTFAIPLGFTMRL